MQPMLYEVPDPTGLTQVEPMQPILYCLISPDSVCNSSFAHTESTHPMLYCLAICDSEPVAGPAPPCT